MADWFSSLASSALKFADELTDSLVSQASEAQALLQEEQQKLKAEEEHKKQIRATNQLLPWETMIEARQILSKALMESILALSSNEKNFSVPAANKSEVTFSMEDFAPTALKMIEIDSNLARMHAKLSPKMNEEDFWLNYYCRIVYLRACSGIDGLEAQKGVEKWAREEIIIPEPRTTEDPASLASAAGRVSPVTSTAHAKSASNTGLGSSPHSASISATKLADSASSRSGTTQQTPAKDELNLEGLDGLSLDDLGDLDDMLGDEMLGDDFENIGSSECNDEELEAQIAKELSEM